MTKAGLFFVAIGCCGILEFLVVGGAFAAVAAVSGTASLTVGLCCLVAGSK